MRFRLGDRDLFRRCGEAMRRDGGDLNRSMSTDGDRRRRGGVVEDDFRLRFDLPEELELRRRVREADTMRYRSLPEDGLRYRRLSEDGLRYRSLSDTDSFSALINCSACNVDALKNELKISIKPGADFSKESLTKLCNKNL